jgi:4-hydroxythreonine-4-phosphate dehydrogenase
MDRPLIAVTMGDPAGIGPEIVLQALEDEAVLAASRPLVIGDRGVLEQAATFCGFQGRIRAVDRPEEGAYEVGAVDLLDLGNVDLSSLRLGLVQGRCGRAAFEYIQRAAELASSRQVDAMATAPINKESLRAGQVDFIGHTEILSALTGVSDPLTMFQVRALRVFFLSRHVSLRKACEMATRERVLSSIQRCLQALQQLGVGMGILAVAGLNPHSGEHGLFEDEEVI